jgi:uncharacterized protein
MLYSTITGSVAHVARSVIEDIEHNRLSKKEQKTLTDLGFLIENAEDEQRELLSFIDTLNAEDTAFRATVVLNLDCNLACTYCFEGMRKGKHFMSAETADAFVEFTKAHIRESDDEINLIFYGGEPLLSQDTLVRISEKLQTFAKKKKLLYEFSLITNGTLLTPRVVDRLVPLGLRAVKVTLDGPREVHDIFRPFRSGKGSFDAIVNNIQQICSRTSVRIGGNYTRESFEKFPRLLGYLLECGLTPDKIAAIKFSPVMNETDDIAPDFNDGCTSVNEPWLVDASISLREAILSRGYRTQEMMPMVCLMERRGVVVNYDGALYKCPGLVGRADFCAGTVRTGMLNYSSSHNLGNWKNEECLACAYLPLCFGGCRYMKLVREGTMKGIDCKKEYFDRTLEAFVLQDVRYENADENI